MFVIKACFDIILSWKELIMTLQSLHYMYILFVIYIFYIYIFVCQDYTYNTTPHYASWRFWCLRGGGEKREGEGGGIFNHLTYSIYKEVYHFVAGLMASMVPILDGNSEHIARAWRKIDLIEGKITICACSRSNQMP